MRLATPLSRLAATLAAAVLVGSALTLVPAESASAGVMTTNVRNQTNAERTKAGLRALELDPNLEKAANELAARMASTGNFAHSSNTWRQSRATKGYTLCCGENIAYGYTSSSAVVSAWMNSEGHRRNILDSRYSHIGVGYSPDGNYWVQIFAAYPWVQASTPTLKGTTRAGYSLWVSMPKWGPGTISYRYTWRANGQVIAGATGDDLKLTQSLIGKRITVTVSGSKTGFRTSTRASAPSAAIRY